MVKICTSKQAVSDLEGIMDVDAAFSAWVQKDMLGTRELAFMKKFEQAEYGDKGELVGRFMEFPLHDVSSGVKTLLLISLQSRGQFGRNIQYINVTECGSNVLDAVFDLANGMDVRLLLLHTRLRGCRDRDFLLNDRIKVSNISELIIRLGKALNGGA
jgi:hypothetical protein